MCSTHTISLNIYNPVVCLSSISEMMKLRLREIEEFAEGPWPNTKPSLGQSL